MAAVTAASPVPVVADESCRGPDDSDRLLAARAAHAINLKLSKLGGPLAALALGRRARAAGLGLMAGAMVETRIGLLAMAHVVAALGGVDWVDLDTAFLLAADPFAGGWQVEGPRIALDDTPGLDVTAAWTAGRLDPVRRRIALAFSLSAPNGKARRRRTRSRDRRPGARPSPARAAWSWRR